MGKRKLQRADFELLNLHAVVCRAVDLWKICLLGVICNYLVTILYTSLRARSISDHVNLPCRYTNCCQPIPTLTWAKAPRIQHSIEPDPDSAVLTRSLYQCLELSDHWATRFDSFRRDVELDEEPFQRSLSCYVHQSLCRAALRLITKGILKVCIDALTVAGSDGKRLTLRLVQQPGSKP